MSGRFAPESLLEKSEKLSGVCRLLREEKAVSKEVKEE